METAEQKLIAFLPWLKLAQPVTIGDVQFIPFRVSDTQETGGFQGLGTPFVRILSSYVDIRNRPVESATVATISRRQPAWNLRDEDFGEVQEASSLLYLAAMATNEYFQQFGSYVNRTIFDLCWQRFTDPVGYITLTVRRRDGELTMAGYKHGKIKFTMPAHADSRDPAIVDGGLVEALNKALAGNSVLLRRLKPALSFLSLANTDSDVMGPPAEVILMGSAFEQFLEAYGARELSQKFGDLFHEFGSVTVGEALKVTPGIVVDPRYAEDQRNWFVDRKWMEEFYHLRSAYVHGDDLSTRTWGWIPLEHLVMAAFAFPLTVKLMLAQDGYYALSSTDKARCGGIDLLLASSQWAQSGGSNATVWQEKLLQSSRKLTVEEAVKAFKEMHPYQSSGSESPEAQEGDTNG